MQYKSKEAQIQTYICTSSILIKRYKPILRANCFNNGAILLSTNLLLMFFLINVSHQLIYDY
jgi:hypothetical protein